MKKPIKIEVTSDHKQTGAKPGLWSKVWRYEIVLPEKFAERYAAAYAKNMYKVFGTGLDVGWSMEFKARADGGVYYTPWNLNRWEVWKKMPAIIKTYFDLIREQHGKKIFGRGLRRKGFEQEAMYNIDGHPAMRQVIYKYVKQDPRWKDMVKAAKKHKVDMDKYNERREKDAFDRAKRLVAKKGFKLCKVGK